jgi:hypothetical protein
MVFESKTHAKTEKLHHFRGMLKHAATEVTLLTELSSYYFQRDKSNGKIGFCYLLFYICRT